MNEQDKAAFAALMTGIAEIYQKKISTALLNIYWRALSRYDLAEIQRAMDTHVVNPSVGQFMAKPADVVSYIEGTAEMRALQAYSKVESAIRHIGSYTSVAFDDPIIHAVIRDMGGWVRFCSIKTEAVPFQTNEFIKRYQGYLSFKRSDYPPYLRGLFDDPKKLPVLVGDKEKAKVVIAGGNDNYQLIHRGEQKQLIHCAKSLEDSNSQNTKGDDGNENF